MKRRELDDLAGAIRALARKPCLPSFCIPCLETDAVELWHAASRLGGGNGATALTQAACDCASVCSTGRVKVSFNGQLLTITFNDGRMIDYRPTLAEAIDDALVGRWTGLCCLSALIPSDLEGHLNDAGYAGPAPTFSELLEATVLGQMSVFWWRELCCAAPLPIEPPEVVPPEIEPPEIQPPEIEPPEIEPPEVNPPVPPAPMCVMPEANSGGFGGGEPMETTGVTDWRPIGIAGRRTLLAECANSSGSDRRVRALGGLSELETGLIWQAVSAPGLRWLKDGCVGRQIVGYEWNWGAGAKPNDFLPSVGKDAEALAFLTEQNWINWDINRKVYTRKGKMAALYSDEGAAFFEWVIDKRKTRLLDNFSLGPTQMHLLWSGPYQAEVMNAPTRCSWPQNWDAIHLMYRATPCEMVDLIGYFSPPCTQTDTTQFNIDDQLGRRTFLTLHTGSSAMTTHYENGTRPWGGSHRKFRDCVVSMDNAIKGA